METGPEMNKMSLWPVEKGIACLKLAVHLELLPSFSEEDLAEFKGMAMFENRTKLVEFVEMVYKRANGNLDIYGNPEEMVELFEKLNNIPELIQFSLNGELHPPFACYLLSVFTAYPDLIHQKLYASKKSCLFKMYKEWSECIMRIDIDDMVRKFYKCWLMGYLGRTVRDLNGTYDLIQADSLDIVTAQLNELYAPGKEREKPVPKGTITYDSFMNLKKYFDGEDQIKIDRFLIVAKIKQNEINAKNQDLYKTIYAEIVYLIEQTNFIFKKHIELFTPYPKGDLGRAQPVIRRLKNDRFDFHLTKEVETALRFVMKSRFPGKKLREDLKILETNDDRRLGFVYGVTQISFERMLRNFDISPDLFIIVEVPLSEDLNGNTLPIISAYGTHCIPAIDAFDKIIYYLAVILKVFQTCSDRYSKRLIDWVVDKMRTLFVEHPMLYLIEIWKVEEVIQQARDELSTFLTEPVDVIPPKEFYTSQELTTHFKNAMKNVGIFGQSMYINYSIIFTHLIAEQLPMNRNINYIYDGCFLMAREYFLGTFTEIFRFDETQKFFEKKRQKTDADILEIEEAIQNLKINQDSGELQKLRREIEELRRENRMLRYQNSRLSNVPLKIEVFRRSLENHHRFFIDLVWTRLQRLNSKYPNSEDISGAKFDVRKLEECYEEFAGKVQKEYEKHL